MSGLDEDKRAIKPDARVPSDLRFPLLRDFKPEGVLQPSAVARRDRPCLRKIRFCPEGESSESAATLLDDGIHVGSFHPRVNEKILFSYSLSLSRGCRNIGKLNFTVSRLRETSLDSRFT